MKFLLPACVALAMYISVMIGGGMLYIDDKARGVHEGYLVTPITKLELVLGSTWPAPSRPCSPASAHGDRLADGRAGRHLPSRWRMLQLLLPDPRHLHRLQRHDVSADGARRRSAGAARHVRRPQPAAVLSFGRHVSHRRISGNGCAPSRSSIPSPMPSTASKPFCSKTAASRPFNSTCCSSLSSASARCSSPRRCSSARVATKGGWERVGPGQWIHNASPKHLEEAVEGSLKRLRLDRLDVYQLHIPDPAVSFDASMETLARLQQQGKIRHIALSNVTLEHVERARKIVPIVSVQNRYSFADREWDFLLDHCEKNRIAFIPWAPLGQNRLAQDVLERVAKQLGATKLQVALAWLLRRSPVTLPIPGTSSVVHVEENIQAAGLHLPDAVFQELSAVSSPPASLR
jgi:hypothetical protein